MTVDRLVTAAAATHGTRPAIVEAGGSGWVPALAALADRSPGARKITWAALEDRVARAAGALQRAGLSPGDRVGVLLPNGIAFAVAYWGALRAGGVVVPVNPSYTPPEAGHILTDADVAAVVAEDRLAALARTAAPSGAAVVSPAELAAGDGDGAIDGDEDAAAVICYTSGTTGRPKGAVLTHRNLLANLAAFSDLERLTLGHDDVLLGVLPFFHIFGLNVILDAAARAGACVVAMERFSPTGSLDVMAATGVTVAYGAPPVFAAWNAVAADAPPLPRLRAAVSGADALPVRTWEGFRDAYGVEILEGYGLTETAPVVTSNACSPAVRPGTVGHPVPGVDVRVLDPAGADVAPGAEGEVAVRGPNVFTGYHGQPEATAEVLRDGWFRTGDTGTLDADGYLTIVGRLKDMLIVSGFNVYPREVEEAILSHPAVAEVAVLGAPDERTGERVRAVVVPHRGADLSEADVRAHCKDRLARYKQPREVELVTALPRTALGKLARARLRSPRPDG